MTDRLSNTLDAIRTALRNGEYAALADLSEQLDAALEDAASLPGADLHALRQRASDTAACLAAARSGFRAARRRLAEVAGGPAALSTYDRDGRRSPAPQGASAPKRL